MTEPDDDLDAILFALTGETAGAGDADEEPFDNTGVEVELNDGSTMTYDEWLAAGQPEPNPEEAPADAPVPAAMPDLSGWADHRRATLSVVGMTQGIGEE